MDLGLFSACRFGGGFGGGLILGSGGLVGLVGLA